MFSFLKLKKYSNIHANETDSNVFISCLNKNIRNDCNKKLVHY